MPELPEVETTRLGVAPHLIGKHVLSLTVRQPQLRWPVPDELIRHLPGQAVESVERRAKYLLVHVKTGSALIHLGMSGSLRILPSSTPAVLHDHIDWQLDSGKSLRFTDPRRFGCQLWQVKGETHPLLRKLGPEPLSENFDGQYLWKLSRNRSIAIKQFLMDQKIVVGVGNIYAAEGLFSAGIRPQRAAHSISRQNYGRLADEIKRILAYAIHRGGTTLRDFLQPDGAPGYFEQELFVYAREGQPCKRCGSVIQKFQQGQRSSFFCPKCQK